MKRLIHLAHLALAIFAFLIEIRETVETLDRVLHGIGLLTG